MGVEAYSVEAELSDSDSVQAMLDEIDRMGMTVDIVLNNVGMQIAYRTDYYKTPVSDYTESFKIKSMIGLPLFCAFNNTEIIAHYQLD